MPAEQNSSDDAERTAAEVWRAWRRGETLARLGTPPRNLDDGYRAQLALERLAGDAYGYKLAATAAAGQAHIGVTHPLFGRLFRRDLCAPGDAIDITAVQMRVAEPEFAFEIGADIPPDASPELLRSSVSTVYLALELPDSRLQAFERQGAAALVADDACGGMFVLGSEVEAGPTTGLAQVPVEVAINDVVVGSGSGANVLGDPWNALSWLHGELAARGRTLAGGEIVTTGVTTAPIPITPGDRLEATFGSLGSVSVAIVARR